MKTLDLRHISILIIPPLVLFVSFLASLLSPDSLIHNYYTSPRNLVNTFFVKKGWLWTIIAYATAFITAKKKTTNSIIRFIILTLSWCLFTQWLIGMPLMDKIFIWTGGKCNVISDDHIPHTVKHLFESIEENWSSSSISSMLCRKIKGKWEGGHDPSGHVFLLTLTISILTFELISLNDFEDILNDLKNLKLSTLFISFIIFLSVTMLFMTGIKYHTIGEQISGLIWSYIVLISVWMFIPDKS
ncbi:hypothetical protein DAMA08_048300 [Martiniozyma asiatica (nom. inval.)]|nr:hypothetical protein DAMA08_048300 [Martiniozyma asiatica]